MFDTILSLLMVIIAWVGGSVPKEPPQPTSRPVTVGEYVVERVVDGDTLVVRVGGREERVRLIGIDAPEEGREGVAKECGADAATGALRALVEGATVQLSTDVSQRDDFGRLLRYVYHEEVLLNEWLVREGYARAVNYPPDEQFAEVLTQAMETAKAEGRGIWSTECASR